jgi:hypothetical protein
LVKYPQMRTWVIEAVKTFADPQYQRRMWVDERGQHPEIIETLDANLAVLYDDTEVARDPSRSIGITLRNNDEAWAIKRLASVLDSLIDKVGATDDATYLADPRWPEVVQAAQEALAVLQAADR